MAEPSGTNQCRLLRSHSQKSPNPQPHPPPAQGSKNLAFSPKNHTFGGGDVAQVYNPGHAGRDREHVEEGVRGEAPVAVAPGGGGDRWISAGGDRRVEAELLGEHADGAAEGRSDEDRGGGELVAAEEGRSRLRRGLPELEGDHEGGCKDPRGLWQAHVPDLAQAGIRFFASDFCELYLILI